MSNQLELAEQKVCAHVLAQYRNRWPPIVASARAAALADQQLVRGPQEAAADWCCRAQAVWRQLN